MTEGRIALSFRFSGGDADENQLNFYDASRFMYGAARLIYTLEHFRQTGRVLGKITQKIRVDYRAPTSRDGSWIQDIVLVAAPIIADNAIKVPIETMVAFVLERLIPSKGKKAEIAEKLIELSNEREKTAREIERTRQNDTHNIEKLISVIEKMADHMMASDASKVTELNAYKEQLMAIQGREAMLADHSDELGKISNDQETRLIDRAKGQVTEMGRQLVRSASTLDVLAGGVSSVSTLERRDVEALEGRFEDPVPTVLVGSIAQYNKENGWGKFRSVEFARPISFVVPSSEKNSMNNDVIDAMKGGEVEVSFYYVKDARGAVKHLVFDNIIGSFDDTY